MLRPFGSQINRMNFGAAAAEQFPARWEAAPLPQSITMRMPSNRTPNRREQVIDIALIQARIHGQRFWSGLDRASFSSKPKDLLLDIVLLVIRQLETGVSENLDAVVLKGIVRRRNHDAGHEVVGAREVGNRPAW